MTNDILIFVEQRNDKTHPAALQCAAPARELAAKTGGQVVACLIGDVLDQSVAAVENAGVDRIVTIVDPALKLYSPLRYRAALAAAVRKVEPRVLMMATTFMGRDLAPRVAVRCGGAVANDVTALDLVDGALDAVRPLYNGKASCHVEFPKDRLAVVTVRPNAFSAPTGGGAAVKESLPYAPAPGDDRVVVKEIVKTGGDVKDVTEADVIVSGGRALKSEANFKIIYELAEVLDAAVGASRAACDAGYQPHSRQVGLTGKTVTPKLYVACGISGAIQHLAGMRGSKTIVAINTDPEAPLFQVADYGIVDDLFKVVPLLKDEIVKLKG